MARPWRTLKYDESSSHRPLAVRQIEGAPTASGKKRAILIVCEGRETERNYFDRMKREGFAREHLAVTVKRGKGGSREQIAQSAVDFKNGAAETFDEVWCVMDAEKAADRDSCERALKTLQDNAVEPCLSNPAFEVWLLSHFQKTTRVYLDCDAVIRDLDPKWKSHFDRDYDKAEPEIFRLVSPLTATAIVNARWSREEYNAGRPILDSNPATDIYRIVERLLAGSNETFMRPVRIHGDHGFVALGGLLQGVHAAGSKVPYGWGGQGYGQRDCRISRQASRPAPPPSCQGIRLPLDL